LPGQRQIDDPEARAHVAKVWGISAEELPQAGLTAQEIMNAIHQGEIKALLSICFNPLVSLPNADFTREALEKLEFFGVVDFFLSETAHHADVVLAGSLQEEDEGVVANVEGRVLHIQKAVDPPGNARPDWTIYCDLARRLGKGSFFNYQRPATFLTSCAKPRAAATRITTASLTKKSTANWACSGRAPRWNIPEHRDCLKT
jgi:assimilatory nitrate reductase catalytic subunit